MVPWYLRVDDSLSLNTPASVPSVMPKLYTLLLVFSCFILLFVGGYQFVGHMYFITFPIRYVIDVDDE